MKTIVLILINFLLISVSAYALKDTIIVHKDSRLDIFTAKEAAVNKLTSQMTSNGKYRGYRLQVLNTRNRESAFNTKADLLKLFPLHKTYVLFQSPYFKVRIGNFLKKPDAVSFQKQLSRTYGQNAYIVEDVIEYTPKDDEYPVLN